MGKVSETGRWSERVLGRVVMRGAMVGEQARAQGKRKRSILEERLCGERGSGVVWKKVCSSWGGSKHEKWLRKESQKVRKEEGGSVASGLEEKVTTVFSIISMRPAPFP